MLRVESIIFRNENFRNSEHYNLIIITDTAPPHVLLRFNDVLMLMLTNPMYYDKSSSTIVSCHRFEYGGSSIEPWLLHTVLCLAKLTAKSHSWKMYGSLTIIYRIKLTYSPNNSVDVTTEQYCGPMQTFILINFIFCCFYRTNDIITYNWFDVLY